MLLQLTCYTSRHALYDGALANHFPVRVPRLLGWTGTQAS
jgi:hypothetical protein